MVSGGGGEVAYMPACVHVHPEEALSLCRPRQWLSRDLRGSHVAMDTPGRVIRVW